MFKRFYDSAFHHPGMAFVGAVPFVIAFALRRPFLLGFLALFTLEILADALFTGALNPAASLGYDKWIGIAFVILGDLRFFVLVEWIASARRRGVRAEDVARAGMGPLRVWLVALAFAFIVPVLSTIPQLALPSVFAASDPLVMNRIFLLYESMFFALAWILRLAVLPKRLAGADPALARWARLATGFEITQYGLWILADVLILATKLDVAYLLRAVPNAMYYVFFVPFVAWTAPPGSLDLGVSRQGKSDGEAR